MNTEADQTVQCAMLRLKDIDTLAFANEVVALAIQNHANHFGGGRHGVAAGKLRSLAMSVATLARDRTWTRTEMTCDLGVIAVATAAGYRPEGVENGTDAGTAFFAWLSRDAPLTGRCDDLVKFVLSCAATVVAIERRDPMNTLAGMDLTSKTREEIIACVAEGRDTDVYEWAVMPTVVQN